jgi:prepilin-type N-terminal cleavage/methylation domain-containing protein
MGGCRGFTLMEILAVLAIISIVTAATFSYGAFGSTGFGKLESSGNQVVDLVDQARQTAVSKNEMTALLVVTDPSNALRNQLMMVYELQSSANGSAATSANWVPSTSWQILYNGVLADPNPSYFTFNNSSDTSSTAGVPSPSLPAITYLAQPVAAYKYVVFTADGGLLSGNSATVRISPGIFPQGSSTVVYTGGTTSGIPNNFYNITILGATGMVKIDRP